MESVPGIVDVDIDREEGMQEAVVDVDADRAADLGLSIGQVADMVSTYILGKAATYYRDRGDEFKVLVRLKAEDRERSSQLERLPIITPTGKRIELGDVARIVRREGPVAIRRLNQQRIVTVSANLEDRDLGSAIEALRPQIDRLRGRGDGVDEIAEGFTVSIGGEFEEQQETFGNLLIGLLLAVALVYMVMASLFESYLHPFIMLLSIPFGAIGVVVTLLATGTTFNVYSFLGSIVLVGVVVNNAIVLLDYTNMLRREQGYELTRAVVEAGKRRLRPILMTTLTTCLALVPVALGLSEGGELQAPLARVIFGGLLASTAITLVFVPTLYHSVENLRQRT
jgi:HAE1 family hydrophobic/amphiphilic exporter-1